MDGEGRKHPMTQADKARIMSTQAKQHGGETEKGSFPARAQRAADKNEPQQSWLTGVTAAYTVNWRTGVSIANCRAELALFLLQTVSTTFYYYLKRFMRDLQWHDTDK